MLILCHPSSACSLTARIALAARLTATKTELSVELLSFYRDTRISQLEQSLAEREDCLLEMRQQRSKYITQLSENTRKIAELETR